MILGASMAQLPIILKAVEMGCYVITIDNIPQNIGHQFSHQSVDCSTVDRAGVCKIAQDLNIDGIVTFASDVATSTVAFVATSLQLSGCELRVAETLSNKANFRLFQQQQQLNHPQFFICKNRDEMDAHYLKIEAPLLFKPTDTSGSRGVTLVDTVNLSHYQKAFSYAHGFSRSGYVSVEEFIGGVDVSGDGFLVNGQLWAVISKKYKRGFIPTGHLFPTDLSAQDQQRVFAEVSAVCLAIGYSDGPVDFDVKISDKRVVVIEMSPRLGGNGIPELTLHHTNVDLIEMTICYALGKKNVLPEKTTPVNGCGSWVFGSEISGTIQSIASENELKKQVKELIACRFNDQIGDTVSSFEHSGNSLGYALFNCPTESDYLSIVARLQSAMQLNVVEQEVS
jgi:biotin carboxylase